LLRAKSPLADAENRALHEKLKVVFGHNSLHSRDLGNVAGMFEYCMVVSTSTQFSNDTINFSRQ